LALMGVFFCVLSRQCARDEDHYELLWRQLDTANEQSRLQYPRAPGCADHRAYCPHKDAVIVQCGICWHKEGRKMFINASMYMRDLQCMWNALATHLCSCHWEDQVRSQLHL
jgi:hypothetical protein